ncbi:MAG: hypothetical protein JST92_13205 [Deltaproteobacteria bacterium]|nr:hypothetical protein [Deltaproteobacteria bacterium]
MAHSSKQPRGVAIAMVLVVIVVLSVLIAFAITVSNRDNVQTAKRVHNLTEQNVAEGALQYARAFFSQNYTSWSTYLGLTYPPDAIGSAAVTFKSAHPELFPAVPSGYTCFVYARDDADELPPATPKPGQDNNHLIYIGAVCNGPANTSAELSATLIWDASRVQYTSQAGEGSHGVNNYHGANNQSVH